MQQIGLPEICIGAQIVIGPPEAAGLGEMAHQLAHGQATLDFELGKAGLARTVEHRTGEVGAEDFEAAGL